MRGEQQTATLTPSPSDSVLHTYPPPPSPIVDAPLQTERRSGDSRRECGGKHGAIQIRHLLRRPPEGLLGHDRYRRLEIRHIEARSKGGQGTPEFPASFRQWPVCHTARQKARQGVPPAAVGDEDPSALGGRGRRPLLGLFLGAGAALGRRRGLLPEKDRWSILRSWCSIQTYKAARLTDLDP
jgi:hypothetical protein